MKKRVNHLVVDSGGFIKASPVHEYAENIYTVKGAIQEIKDKETLQRLQFLPYTLKVKEPSAEAIKYVTEYSKKTGDYSSLSAVDMQILALTYQLEKENVGIAHLNKEPSCKIENKPAFSEKDMCGFYVPKRKSDTSIKLESDSNNLNDGDITEENNSEKNQTDENSNNDVNEEIIRNEKNISQDKDEIKDVAQSEENVSEEESEEEENECDDDDDDEDGWVTPENIAEIQEKMNGLKLDSSVEVACVTTDFCIQNVLIQMGLNVVSVEGMLIKQARVFILRCYSCFKTTNNVTKQFCSNCGNKTLKRVSVSVNDDGLKQIHINFRRPLPIRGTRYSLPLPKGGKHSMNPVLCEDQPLPHNRLRKKAVQQINAMEEDYIVRSSPFAYHDNLYERRLFPFLINELLSFDLQDGSWVRQRKLSVGHLVAAHPHICLLHRGGILFFLLHHPQRFHTLHQRFDSRHRLPFEGGQFCQLLFQQHG
ncbi:RNA-binding protein NOB1 [Caerostris darwini]|uniref:RNA-binding protein NOB1 n=1 Tax=Caerostris darwini TaxID=1538125 RepID=A0AAV4PN24_9ARAC|nr:RNA-binding protein NOB1 [Caerostris darwini]